VLIALFLLAPANAGAASWTFARTITGPPVFPMSATVNHDGHALFAWESGRNIWVRARPRGGPLRPVQSLSSTALNLTPVAGNLAGEAVVAWGETDAQYGFPTREVTAIRRAGGAFGPPQTLYTASGDEGICDEAAAIAETGEAIVVFSVVAGGPYPAACRVYAAVRSPGANGFGNPVALPSATGDQLRVAFDRRGNALIAWTDRVAHKVQVVRHRTSGVFEPAQAVAVPDEDVAEAGFGPLHLQVAPGGHAIIAFPTQAPDTRQVGAAVGDTQAGFGRAVRLADSGTAQLGRSAHFDAAAGADGTLAVAWRSGASMNRHIQVAAVGPRRRSISERDTATLPGNHATEVKLAISDTGRVLVAQTRLLRGRLRAVEVATRVRGRGYTTPQPLSNRGAGSGAALGLSTNSSGRAFLVWLEGTNGKQTLHWAATDRAGVFSRARRILHGDAVFGPALFRGTRGAMLATVSRTSGEWQVLTFGER
jgi:hypothetical protein